MHNIVIILNNEFDRDTIIDNGALTKSAAGRVFYIQQIFRHWVNFLAPMLNS